MFGIFARTNKAQTLRRLPDQVGFFGKMPIHNDFIRHNVQARDVAAFEKWIQEGVGLITRKHPGGWPEPYRNFSRLHFVQTGGEQERTLAGTLVASRDRSGRNYPFAIFVATDDLLFRQMQAAAPYAFGEFLHGCETICNENWTSEPLSLLAGRVDGLTRRDTGLTRRQALEAEIGLFRDIPMGRFWHGALPEGDPAARVRLFGALFGALRTVVRRGPNRTSWGLRLPIPGGDNQMPFVVFWIQLIEAILEERNWRAHYFWNRTGTAFPASLTVFFRPLPGSCLPQLLNPAVEDGSIVELLRQMTSPTESRPNPDLKKLLASADAPMLEVLYKVGRREVLQ